MAAQGPHPVYRLTADGVVGNSGAPTRGYSFTVTCGAAAGSCAFHDATGASNQKLLINCPANDTRTVFCDEANYPHGMYADLTGANTEISVEVDQSA